MVFEVKTMIITLLELLLMELKLLVKLKYQKRFKKICDHEIEMSLSIKKPPDVQAKTLSFRLKRRHPICNFSGSFLR